MMIDSRRWWNRKWQAYAGPTLGAGAEQKRDIKQLDQQLVGHDPLHLLDLSFKGRGSSFAQRPGSCTNGPLR